MINARRAPRGLTARGRTRLTGAFDWMGTRAPGVAYGTDLMTMPCPGGDASTGEPQHPAQRIGCLSAGFETLKAIVVEDNGRRPGGILGQKWRTAALCGCRVVEVDVQKGDPVRRVAKRLGYPTDDEPDAGPLREAGRGRRSRSRRSRGRSGPVRSPASSGIAGSKVSCR